jgi:anti-sigma factor ChrR (cupin superfamily)
MRPHGILDDDTRAQAALHALGSLPPDDAAAYERHLTTCAPCRDEVQAARQALGQLAAIAPRQTPPPSLRRRVLDRIHAEPRPSPEVQAWKAWAPQLSPEGGSIFVAGVEGLWERTAIEGIEARRLFVDAANDRVTMLVRMAAGTAYPAHVHGGPEECYVLAGDLRVGEGIHMRAGDYQRVEKGYRHPVQSTDGGCLLLLISSLHDELVDTSSSAITARAPV